MMNCVELAKKYNQFQIDIGQGLETNTDHVISTLFSKSFQKIANGETLVADRNGLKDQILICREEAGPWTIDVKEVEALQDPGRCFIRYQLVSEKLGGFDVMATLRSSSDGLIEEVDEIYYQTANISSL